MRQFHKQPIANVFVRKTFICNTFVFKTFASKTYVFKLSILAKFILIFFAAVILINCGSSSSKKELTLGSLSQGLPKINPQALPSATVSSARSSYKKLAKTAEDKDLRARALERLADLQLESHQYKKEKTEEQTIKDIAPKIKTQPKSSFDEDNVKYNDVAKQYQALIKRNPNSKENERILYQLARAYDLGGQTNKSLATLDQILRKFPRTRKKEEIQFRRGEILFQKKSYPKASRAYRVIVANEDSDYYERALYKYGWSLFKQNKLSRAIEAFYQLLDYYLVEKGYLLNKKPGAKLSKGKLSIVKDTFRVVSLSLSLLKGAKSIRKFNKKLGPRSYEDKVYKTLAELYVNQDRKDDATKTYSAFIKYYPHHRKAPEYYLRIIEIFESAGYTKSIIQAKEDFVERYGFSRIFWTKHDRLLMKKLAPQIQSNIEDLASHYHARGQKFKKNFDYKMAAKYYREFVESFPQDKKAANMNFLLAESLNDSADYDAAAIAYENTAYNYTHYKKSAIAGYTAILVRQKFYKNLKGEGRIAGVNDTVVSSIRFADNFPNHKQVPAVLLKAAEELVSLKRYSEASALAHRITKLNHKRSKKFKKAAWAIIAKVEFDLGRLKSAEMASLKRLEYTNPDDKDRKAQLQRLAATIYQQGEQARKEGKLFEAASHFLRVGKLAPTSAIKITAEYDAAAAYVKIKEWDRAIPILNRFIRLNPKHKLTAGAIDKLAVSYEQSEQWKYAAATYEEIARRTRKSKNKSDLLWKTAELYEKAKLKKNAIDVYKRIVEKFPRPVEPAVEARLKLADIYKDTNQPKKREFWLKMIMKADGRDGSTERTRFVAAKAAMELAEPTFISFKKVKLVQPLKKSLKKKKLLLQRCLAAYTAAASYGIEEITTASTYQIGEIYNEFSQVLYNSERPKGLNETELEQYDMLLEEQAFPFEEKAIEIHTTNTNRASNGTYDSWVKKSFQILREMLPARYAKNEKSELFNSLIN